jgi:hypothetical protein
MDYNSTDIIDFTDIAKPVFFKYNDDFFAIPSFTKKQIKTLMILGSAANNFKNEEQEDNNLNSTINYFDTLDEYILAAVVKCNKANSIEGAKSIESEDIDHWPITIKNKIMNLINTQMNSLSAMDDGDSLKK